MSYENNTCGKNHIKGITCDVKSCVHHGNGNCCCADMISVGPAGAQCSGETACVTFRPREED